MTPTLVCHIFLMSLSILLSNCKSVRTANKASAVKSYMVPGVTLKDRYIIVCFESPQPGGISDRARANIQDAISTAYIPAGLYFVGWLPCSQDLFTETHNTLKITKVTLEDAVNGGFGYAYPMNIYLQTDCFNSVPPDHCPDLRFMRYAAVHETGHALGLQHEHSRDDATTCKNELLDPNGIKITEYDPDSVMNYCGANTEKLSELDISGLIEYYSRAYDRNGDGDLNDPEDRAVSASWPLGVIDRNCLPAPHPFIIDGNDPRYTYKKGDNDQSCANLETIPPGSNICKTDELNPSYYYKCVLKDELPYWACYQGTC